MYYSLVIDSTDEGAELLQAVLDATGPLGLEVRDSTLKPPPGAPPLASGQVQVIAYYEDDHEADDAARQVRREFPDSRVEFRPVVEEDWAETWKKHVRAVRVGRIWVGPSWELQKAGDTPHKLVIEPGMAFGTGDHPTTAMCLQGLQDALDRHPGASVLDVGTGSGILAIAARQLGASRVLGNDIDPAAIRIARENAERNGVTGIEFTEKPLERLGLGYDVVVANLFSGVLCQLAPRLAARLAKDGRLLVTGILAPQAPEVDVALQREGLKPAGRRGSGEWVMLQFERP